ncbi:(2Fe-2S)-binding protein [Stappia sp.]|jgi:isoquinoline 1-oxidoreductase alpha subunit|uniref:(2Fe-2S)-binding protein n=1 Tax=Stappia sp. TaxID=1870903 RepID=UPI003A992203
MVQLTVNGENRSLDIDPETPLLWVLRDELQMTGTKFGCGIAACGACTVHMDGMPIRSCQTQVGDVEGTSITTIEGVSGKAAEAVQSAWRELDVPQCGYCQSGQILAATALLQDTPKPSDEDIDAAMSGNVCRCATYPRIRAAIHRAAETMEG